MFVNNDTVESDYIAIADELSVGLSICQEQDKSRCCFNVRIAGRAISG
jgi:hypothetical protein